MLNSFNPIDGIDREYDKLLKIIREWYDTEVKTGEAVQITVYAKKMKISGRQRTINDCP